MSEVAPSGTAARVGTVMRAPKTAELIATHLRRQIVKGELKPGDTLPPEVELMAQFGVSRPTLREAFRILEAESIIRVRRGARGGAQVLEPDPGVAARHVALLLQLQGTTVRDVYEARMLTEPVCAGMLARHHTDQDLADLREVVSTLDETVDRPQAALDMWTSCSYRFHELILQRCGNNTLAIQGGVLAEIVATHHQQVIATKQADQVDMPPLMRKTIRSFRKLIDLVEAGDVTGAEEHWKRHMKVSAGYMFLGDKKNMPVVDLFS